MDRELPKILIVSRLVWDDSGSSNTLSNIFANYDAERISRIYIETIPPNTKCCFRFFQISEIALLKKLFKWRTKTGKVINTKHSLVLTEKEIRREHKREKEEAGIMNYVRKHRSGIFTILRDILWGFNGWKSKELRKFVIESNPDIIWLDGSPLILMNRLNNYVRNLLPNTPALTFLMDDVYNYHSCASGFDKLYKFFLRKQVKKTVDSCQHVFVASPKMEEEYDNIFGVESTFITKSFEINDNVEFKAPKGQTRLVYLGNILIGRLGTLISIAEVIREINQNSIKLTLDIYTGNHISQDKLELLNVPGVTIHPSVPYSEVPQIIEKADVQIFVESFEGKAKNIARLSFSTKIIDYLLSGKSILAAGDKDLAPIEYFKKQDAALVATNQNELKESLLKLTDPNMVVEYAKKAYECGKINHNKAYMDSIIFGKLKDLAEKPINH